MPESPHFVSRKICWSGLVEAGLFTGLAASWLGLFGGWYWLLDLFSHFRWQYVAVCVGSIGWGWWRKRRVMLWISLATLLLNGGLIANAPNIIMWVASSFRVRVVSLNVLTSNPDKLAVLRYLQSADADIIFLMEVDRAWEKALQPLLGTHPYFLVHPQNDNFGIAFYSRYPVESLRLLTPEDLGLTGNSYSDSITNSVETNFKISGREFIVIGTHPVPPITADYAVARDRQLQALTRRIAAADRPVLLVGDLNATPWSKGVRIIKSDSPLRLAPGSWKPTWRTGSVFALPIDLSLTSDPLVVRLREIGPDVGSDHRPQVLDLAWKVGIDG